MLPWQDNSTQTKVTKTFPLLCAIGCFVVAAALYVYRFIL